MRKFRFSSTLKVPAHERRTPNQKRQNQLHCSQGDQCKILWPLCFGLCSTTPKAVIKNSTWNKAFRFFKSSIVRKMSVFFYMIQMIFSLKLRHCMWKTRYFFQIMAGKFLHVMAVLFNQSHAAAVTTNSQSVYTWKFHSVIDRTSKRRRERNKMAFSLHLKRVLISDSVDSCCKTILEANGIAVDLKTKLTKEELLAEIAVRGR